MDTFVRKLGLVLAAGALSVGMVGFAAPEAHADTSWGFRKVR